MFDIMKLLDLNGRNQFGNVVATVASNHHYDCCDETCFLCGGVCLSVVCCSGM